MKALIISGYSRKIGSVNMVDTPDCGWFGLFYHVHTSYSE
jgi:hypothetical protein